MMTMDKLHRLRERLEGARVKRCHTADYHGHYDVGQHSFAMLLIYCTLHPSPQKGTMLAIMAHDLAERYTGDIPAPVLLGDDMMREHMAQAEEELRERMGIQWNLDYEEERWLWGCDRLEHWLWAMRQHRMGNTLISHHLDWARETVGSMDLPDPLRELYTFFDHDHGRDTL